jgi:hypothetical protein
MVVGLLHVSLEILPTCIIQITRTGSASSLSPATTPIATRSSTANPTAHFTPRTWTVAEKSMPQLELCN